MLTDGRSVAAGERLHFDVCIIGAGAAGITLARELAGHAARIALVESGGFELGLETQALYRGENVGLPYFDLDACRLRYFGGSTNHWTGYSRPLDPVDFEVRDWIPDSGWPIGRSDLDPYYRRAQAILELGPYRYDSAIWEQAARSSPLPLDPDAFRAEVFQLSPPTRFGTVYRDPVVKAPNLQLIHHTNVVAIETTRNGRVVESVRVAALAGNEFHLEARLFVLATGGIENPRILLASQSPAHPRGLGNQHDLVGRYFMEHPHLAAAYFVPSDPAFEDTFYRTVQTAHGRFLGAIVFHPELIRRERMNNVSATLLATNRVDDDFLEAMTSPGVAAFDHLVRYIGGGTVPGDFARSLWKVIHNLDDVAAVKIGSEAEHAVEGQMYQVFFRAEQAPNPDSRVTLGDEKDALGMPRVRLGWRLSNRDFETLERAHQLLGAEIGRAGVGRVFLPPLDSDRTWADDLFGGYHHMGTTRMHQDPKRGVADAHCRVHGIANLYIAGSSLFPTVGFANPTLTLVALAVRLGDRIKGLLQ